MKSTFHWVKDVSAPIKARVPVEYIKSWLHLSQLQNSHGLRYDQDLALNVQSNPWEEKKINKKNVVTTAPVQTPSKLPVQHSFHFTLIVPVHTHIMDKALLCMCFVRGPQLPTQWNKGDCLFSGAKEIHYFPDLLNMTYRCHLRLWALIQ